MCSSDLVLDGKPASEDRLIGHAKGLLAELAGSLNAAISVDRKSVGEGKSVDRGGRRIIKKKKTETKKNRKKRNKTKTKNNKKQGRR